MGSDALLLLHRPDIVVLDEETSALDPNSQDKLMELLTTELDATTIVSVGHRPELEAFHSPQNRARAEPRQKLRRRALKVRLKPWRKISALGQSR